MNEMNAKLIMEWEQRMKAAGWLRYPSGKWEYKDQIDGKRITIPNRIAKRWLQWNSVPQIEILAAIERNSDKIFFS